MKTKTILFICILSLCLTDLQAQWTNKTMISGGLTRSYRLYVSPNYNPVNPASLVVTLHGLGDNMTNFSNLGFAQIGDTANIIVICPQAVTDPFAGTAWNSGAGYMGYFPNASVNDIGFINALVDSTMDQYAVNPKRVYLCGFSMGGFMTQRMALQSNTRFAAFASLSGTIGAAITPDNPSRLIPMAHWHGTADGTIAFTGNTYGIDPDSLISLWITYNNCNPVPDTSIYPDNNPGDSILVTQYRFSGPGDDARVYFYVMDGAGHTVLFPPANDINQTREVWLFFRQFEWAEAGIAAKNENLPWFSVYPNPAGDFVTLTSERGRQADILDISGKVLWSKTGLQGSEILDLSAFSPGLYLIRLSGESGSAVQKLIIQ